MSGVAIGSRLRMDDALNRRVHAIEQMPKRVDPTGSVGFGGAGETDGVCLDYRGAALTRPKDLRAANRQSNRTQLQIALQLAAAMTSTRAATALLAGASGKASTVDWWSKAARRTRSSSGMTPATDGPAPRSR